MLTTLHKKQISEAQLNASIRCYLARDYISAVTLSGAAEEIYAAFIKNCRVKNTHGRPYTSLGLHVSFRRIQGSTTANRTLIGVANKLRNEFKHHGKSNLERVRVNLPVAATVFIYRALENYFRIGGTRNSLIIRYEAKARKVG